MKLYIGLTAFHLLSACALVIKNKEDNAELLVEGITEQEPELVVKIRDSNIFSKVYYVNQTNAWKEIDKLDIDDDAGKIDEAVKSAIEFWKKNFKHFKHIISRYSNICIWDDHFTLGMALAYLKIPYAYYEESPGCNYRRDVFINLSVDHITNKAFAPTTIQYGLRGKYTYATSYNYDFDLNPMERGERDQDFSLVKNLKEIRESDLEGFRRLEQIFASEGYFIKKNSMTERENILLIGQHYSQSLYSNTNMIRYVLSMLVDYFGENMNLWIKNHPSNYFNPFQAWFPDANVINEKIPIELLCIENIVKFQRVISISSSAPLVMQDSNTDIILFHNMTDGDSFESKKRFLDLHKYYIVARLIESIWHRYDMHELYMVGIEILSWNYLNKFQNIDLPQMQYAKDLNELRECNQKKERVDKCYVIDYKNLCGEISILEWLMQISNESIAFLVNFDEVDIFSRMEEQDIVDYIFPLPIDIVDKSGNSGLFGAGIPETPLKNTVEKMHKERYQDFSYKERQIVYMYTKSADIANSVLTQSIEKKLSRCGLDVVYNPLELNYRELVFESMLEQLECQYIKLQSENNELLEQIQKYRNIEENINIVHDLAYGEEVTSLNRSIIESINASSTMLMERMTEIDTRIIKFHSWYGLKLRIKEKWHSIIKRRNL